MPYKSKYLKKMFNTNQKMKVLSDSAQYDLCDNVNHDKDSDVNLPGIYNSSYNGCQVPIFKVLMTNKCNNDCKYCINQSKRNFTRLELSPEEIRRVFLDYYNKRYVDGLFLSTGISKNIDETMEKTIEVARKLRIENGYDGYIHLKILPGASKDSIKRAMSLATRVSVNIEAATPDGLSELSSTKDFNKDIIRRFKWIKSFHERDPNMAPSGQTTQMIVGANDETDLEILKTTKKLYDKLNIKRTYFSAFESEEGTVLEDKKSCNRQRGVQLYKADALLSKYNFSLDEFKFDKGLLSVEEDPKYLAALERDIFPLDVNTATFSQLIRVPGIGEVSAKKIISERKNKEFKDLRDLKELGINTERSSQFLKLGSSYQTALDLFS